MCTKMYVANAARLMSKSLGCETLLPVLRTCGRTASNCGGGIMVNSEGGWEKKISALM
jgi:hypothetical protein